MNRLAFYHLTQLFRDLGEIPRAEVCARRVSLLERYESVLGAPPTTLEQLRDAAEIAESLQRPWEALGWAHEAVRLFPDDRSSPALVARLQSEALPQESLCAMASHTEWNIRPAEYPLPDWSSRHGSFLSVRLRGVVSDREAIGATVRVTAKGKTWSRQLVGDDGFAASNERVLTFGLGEIESIDSISVAWPAGTDEVFPEAVPTDSELLLVEGSRRIVFLHRNP